MEEIYYYFVMSKVSQPLTLIYHREIWSPQIKLASSSLTLSLLFSFRRTPLPLPKFIVVVIFSNSLSFVKWSSKHHYLWTISSISESKSTAMRSSETSCPNHPSALGHHWSWKRNRDDHTRISLALLLIRHFCSDWTAVWSPDCGPATIFDHSQSFFRALIPRSHHLSSSSVLILCHHCTLTFADLFEPPKQGM